MPRSNSPSRLLRSLRRKVKNLLRKNKEIHYQNGLLKERNLQLERRLAMAENEIRELKKRPFVKPIDRDEQRAREYLKEQKARSRYLVENNRY